MLMAERFLLNSAPRKVNSLFYLVHWESIEVFAINVQSTSGNWQSTDTRSRSK